MLQESSSSQSGTGSIKILMINLFKVSGAWHACLLYLVSYIWHQSNDTTVYKDRVLWMFTSCVWQSLWLRCSYVSSATLKLIASGTQNDHTRSADSTCCITKVMHICCFSQYKLHIRYDLHKITYSVEYQIRQRLQSCMHNIRQNNPIQSNAMQSNPIQFLHKIIWLTRTWSSATIIDDVQDVSNVRSFAILTRSFLLKTIQSETFLYW